MFDQLIIVGELLVNSISNFAPKRNKKRSVGKHLSSIYRDLTILLENADEILRLFRRHNNGKDIVIDEIKTLLVEQHVLIQRLSSVLRKKDIQTILSIQAPQIKPLQFLLFNKGFRIKFYLDKINEKDKKRSDGDKIEWIRHVERIDLPNNNSINRVRKQLRKIRSVAEELRLYIINQFEINEII